MNYTIKKEKTQHTPCRLPYTRAGIKKPTQKRAFFKFWPSLCTKST